MLTRVVDVVLLLNCNRSRSGTVTTISERITERAFDLLEKTPEGLRYSELVRQNLQGDVAFNQNTIHGTVWNLDERFPDKIYKPSRGLFRLMKFRAIETDQLKDELVPKQPKRIKETDFYEPFADWLQNEMEECTKAIALGGSRFRDKWGTPDVIGKRESRRSDIIQCPWKSFLQRLNQMSHSWLPHLARLVPIACSVTKSTWWFLIGPQTTKWPVLMRCAKYLAWVSSCLILEIPMILASPFVRGRVISNRTCSMRIGT